MSAGEVQQFDIIVIGGGQAGLSVGYHLARRGHQFAILDAAARVGDAWRNRWQSLRLFSPARFDGLEGMPFPAPAHSFPTRDEMADYLEAYAARFHLPVRTSTRVTRLARRGDVYRLSTSAGELEAAHVVVAMSSYQSPRTPPFAQALDPGIVQLHSADYRAPEQLKAGDVLIIGAGNSGAEIAAEVAPWHRTWVAGRDTGQVPFDTTGLAARWFLARFFFRVLFHRVLTVDTWIGRKARPAIVAHGGPLIRTRRKDLTAAGVKFVPRVIGTRDGHPLVEDGRTLDVSNVIWCTGFDPGFAWIDLPVLDADGLPHHTRGVVAGEPGLYFVGLNFLYALSSTMIHGVGRDARHVVSLIEKRLNGSHLGHPNERITD